MFIKFVKIRKTLISQVSSSHLVFEFGIDYVVTYTYKRAALVPCAHIAMLFSSLFVFVASKIIILSVFFHDSEFYFIFKFTGILKL